MLSSRVKHLLHSVFYVVLLAFFGWFLWPSPPDPEPEYGLVLLAILRLLQVLPFLGILHTISVATGLFGYNAFEDRVELGSSPQLAPFLCFRMVTRGDFPALVRANAERNRNICLDAGLHHFVVEVVTDSPVGVVKDPHCQELVVPAGYKTSSGTQYKARALQYCLEPEVNQLMDDDWIVHLDEETVVTCRSVHGILNFVNSGKHQFGQGLITYANEEVVNWLTTLADTYRVADDMGRIRGELRTLHCPISGWKGSYMVAQAGAERKVSFDHGLESSIAEDAFFAMMATMQGYTFDFIAGEMWEKSPFTIMDFIRQRKRWVQGICLLVHSPRISLRTKWVLSVNFYAWATTPVTFLSAVAMHLFPMKVMWLTSVLYTFLLTTTIYMYIFGVFKSISISRHGLAKFLLCLLSCLLLLPCYMVLENVAIVWGLLSRSYSFYIVQKAVKNPTLKV